MIKKSTKITASALLSAMSVVIMLLSYFPYATYAVPAVAGVMFMVINIEIDKKYAFVSYLITAVIAILLCEKESSVLFSFFFGYYPILKGIIEGKRLKRILEYLFKFAVFNIGVIFSYIIIVNILGIPLESTGEFGKYFAVILLILGNIVFFFYDIGLTRLITVYFNKLHTKISKLLKK